MALELKPSHRNYLILPFSSETPKESFFQFWSIPECFEKCTEDCEDIKKCRTIGILYSECGCYYLKDLEDEIHIRLSVKYLASPVASTIIPYPVQIFGELQWKKRPVIFVSIMQVLKVSTALRMVKTLRSIIENYQPHSKPCCDNDET